jgi:hypothetical protein
MSIDNQDLMLDATDPLARAHRALRIIQQHAAVCALVALAGDVRRIADQLDHGRTPTLAHPRGSGGHQPPEVAQ